MSLFTAVLAAHVISSVSPCNQVVVKSIKGAVCASLDFDNEINSKITFETGCTYIVTDCNITASAAGEMEHKAGSSFVMKGGTTVTLNGIARVAGEIGIEGGTYLNNNLLLISETGVFRVHQNGEATNSKTGSFYIAGDFVNENLFTNLGADSDGDNSGVPFGVSNDGTITNHKNITNLGTIKNKGTILNKQGGIINNERQAGAAPPCNGLCKACPADAQDGPIDLLGADGTTTSGYCVSDPEPHGGGAWTLLFQMAEVDNTYSSEDSSENGPFKSNDNSWTKGCPNCADFPPPQKDWYESWTDATQGRPKEGVDWRGVLEAGKSYDFRSRVFINSHSGSRSKEIDVYYSFTYPGFVTQDDGPPSTPTQKHTNIWKMDLEGDGCPRVYTDNSGHTYSYSVTSDSTSEHYGGCGPEGETFFYPPFHDMNTNHVDGCQGYSWGSGGPCSADAYRGSAGFVIPMLPYQGRDPPSLPWIPHHPAGSSCMVWGKHSESYNYCDDLGVTFQYLVRPRAD